MRRLATSLAELPDLVVAVSGGVDSAVLWHAAHTTLGARAVGWIGDSPALPRSELAEAQELATLLDAHLVIQATEELASEGYRRNAGTRCYFCRRVLFETMASWAMTNGFRVLGYGEITDDWSDVRPGRRAAHELGVVAPLAAAGFSKADVRRYAREHGLPVAEKPAAACLSSRVPQGTEVTAARLARIERAEEAVRALGFLVLRVRDHGARARVEVGADERERAEALRARVARALLPLDFDEVELATYGEQSSTSPPARMARR